MIRDAMSLAGICRQGAHRCVPDAAVSGSNNTGKKGSPSLPRLHREPRLPWDGPATPEAPRCGLGVVPLRAGWRMHAGLFQWARWDACAAAMRTRWSASRPRLEG
ncbi:hypothetical protein C2W62_34920 [Candidatus Entotheonella serta]|nr:hypothetical protein C2W62_34920 [Candidatus Entotheonella serta]